jgi:hypothetical protein
MRSRLNGRLWEELTEEEHRRMPGDYEAQVSQGSTAHHSEEHLVTSDRGIAMLRRVLQEQVERVARGEDPAGVSFDLDAPAVVFDAGNWLDEPPAASSNLAPLTGRQRPILLKNSGRAR